ncbi:MAG: respiratory nitrate reductase subunit gamma [Anaerolineae bacterium]
MADLIAQRLPLFWRTMAVAAIPFALVVWRLLWLLGRAGAGNGQTGPMGVRGVAVAIWHGPASGAPGTRRPGWRPFVVHLLADGVLHRRLWRTSKGRWLAHSGILIGFIGLMSMSALAALADHVLRPLGVAGPAVAVILNKDHPLMALTNETFGLVLLLGGLAAAGRRFFWRGPYLPNERPDVLAVALLLFIIVGGYPLEALRLLMEATPAEAARYSYMGWPLARLLAPFALPWAEWHFWTFQSHIFASIALFVYWPLSKMMHVIAGPAIAGLGAAEVRPTR